MKTIIVNTKEPPIDFNEAPRQGYINIYYMDNEYHLELHVGVQSFKLDYSNEDYEAVRWLAKQFVRALNRTVGDVCLYGTEPERRHPNKQVRTTNMNNLTDLKEQLQEDMITYFANSGHARPDGVNIDELCQIIVDRVTELQNNAFVNEDYPEEAITGGNKKLREMLDKSRGRDD